MPNRARLYALDADGRGVRVVLEQANDLFTYRVDATTRDSHTTLLCSRNAPEDGMGPETPAFQEMHQQEVEGHGPVLFLTGASCGDYWSATVCQSAPIARGVDFDVSCRRANNVVPAAVRFTAPRATMLQTAPDLLEAETDGVRWSLVVEDSTPRAYLAEWDDPWIACDPDGGADQPCVLRWRFSVRAG